MSLNRFKLLFFGSDNFSVRVLNRLLGRKLIPIEVVTKSGSLLDQYSARNHLNVHRWPLEPMSIKEHDLNIGIVASFGHLINVDIIKQLNYGLFNVHPSLLPQFRGASPIQAAILNDLKETGCTIMEIPPVEKFDIGKIVLQEKLPVKRGEYSFELSSRLADIGADMFEEFLLNYDICRSKSRPQSEENKSYAKKIKPEQGLIRFKSESADLIDRKVRAYTGTIDLFTLYMDIKVKLEAMRDKREVESINLERALNIHYTSMGLNYYSAMPPEPGTLFFHKPRQLLGIKTADGQWAAFDFMTPETKHKMTAIEFYNGYLSSMEPENLITDV